MRLPHLLAAAVLALPSPAKADGADFFEKDVRPLLVEKCQSCHDDTKAKGGLRLTDRASLLAGGDSGADTGLLLKAVKYDGDLKMPPKGKLSAAEIAVFENWAKAGFPWPDAGGPAKVRKTFAITDEDRNWWAYRPIANPPAPAVKTGGWAKSDLDKFILAGLEAKGLKPAPPAEPRALIRRMTFDLTGLPPTPDEVEAFVAACANDRDAAVKQLVDRLLASPRYGERWGRHWLDLVRYTDSFDARGIGGETDVPHAWRYRDWVVNAFNRDLPYSDFLAHQFAGDVISARTGRDPDKVVATGMLALGNWGGGDSDKEKLLTDIADDQVDLLGRTVLGVTLACARCHDHKFDPFSTEDYYGLAGIFFSTHILASVGPKTNGPPMLKIPLEPLPPPTPAAVVLAKRVTAAKTPVVIWRGNPECPNVLANGSDAEAVLQTIKMPAKTVALHPGPGTDVAAVWTAPIAGGVTVAGQLTDFDPTCGDGFAWELRHVAAKGKSKSLGGGSVGNGKAAKFADLAVTVGSGDRLELVVKRNAEYSCDTTGVTLVVSGKDQTWDFAADWLKAMPDREAKAGVWSAEELTGGAVKYTGPSAHGAQEGGVPGSPHAGTHDVKVHIRGRYDRLGTLVPRRFPTILAGPAQPSIRTGSGRLELTEWLARKENPLTSRVMANRIWQYHFGEGLVRTPSNFGRLGEKPSHPELLDWLATRFVDYGWSMKALHRRILLSATYQQAADGDPATAKADPENRLLGRFPRRRLESEPLRDALLAVAGTLDPKPGGPSVRDFNSPRRTLYITTIRSDRTGFGPLFDVADNTAPTDKRTVSTVAPQALFLLNHPFVAARVKELAKRVEASGKDESARLAFAYRLLYGRPPTADEEKIATGFLKAGGGWEGLCKVLVCANEFMYLD